MKWCDKEEPKSQDLWLSEFASIVCTSEVDSYCGSLQTTGGASGDGGCGGAHSAAGGASAGAGSTTATGSATGGSGAGAGTWVFDTV